MVLMGIKIKQLVITFINKVIISHPLLRLVAVAIRKRKQTTNDWSYLFIIFYFYIKLNLFKFL
jgi:superfamily I DNA and RNA helicase